MKVIEEKIYTTKKTYQAEDGKIFDSMEECVKYESTAKHAIAQGFNKTFGVPSFEDMANCNIIPMWGLTPDFDGIFAIKINNAEELAVANGFMKSEGINDMLGAEDIGKVHVFDYYDETDYYYYGTVDRLRGEFEELLNRFEKMAER